MWLITIKCLAKTGTNVANSIEDNQQFLARTFLKNNFGKTIYVEYFQFPNNYKKLCSCSISILLVH